MARTLDAMATSGAAKMRRKATSMSTSWNAAKARMKTGYGDQPFGPTRKANYNAGVEAGAHRVDVDKWEKNWRAKMAE